VSFALGSTLSSSPAWRKFPGLSVLLCKALDVVIGFAGTVFTFEMLGDLDWFHDRSMDPDASSPLSFFPAFYMIVACSAPHLMAALGRERRGKGSIATSVCGNGLKSQRMSPNFWRSSSIGFQNYHVVLLSSEDSGNIDEALMKRSLTMICRFSYDGVVTCLFGSPLHNNDLASLVRCATFDVVQSEASEAILSNLMRALAHPPTIPTSNSSSRCRTRVTARWRNPWAFLVTAVSRSRKFDHVFSLM